jgi:Ca-activated chloride channel homolog
MYFIWPAMLLSLLVIPLFVLVYLSLQRRRRRMAAAAGSLGWVQSAARSPGARRHIPMVLFLTALTILLVALARPQTVIAVPRIQGTVILAFDISGSMAADDLKPTRMDAAKAAARDFVQRQPSSVQIGVVAFSDGGVAMQSVSNDQASVLAAIDRLSPQRGTSLAQGIQASLKALAASANQSLSDSGYPAPPLAPVASGTTTSSVIVLLSDGENNESPDPLAAAQTAAKVGVRIYTVGIGSPAGTNLHINGFTVHTQLDEGLLQQIAQTTGGTYYNAQSTQSLQAIYSNLNPQLTIAQERTEVTSLFAGAGILVFLIGATFSLLWFNRLP